MSGDIKGDSTIEIQRVKETVVESGPKPKTIAVGGDVQITSGGGSHVEVQTTSTSGAGVATHAILILFDFFGLSSERLLFACVPSGNFLFSV